MPALQSPLEPLYADLPPALPVFPLTGAVLFPGGRLPLNIFEPRYLAMVRAALSSPDRLIGMVQPAEPGADRTLDPASRPRLSRIGCVGRIVGFQETDDARYLITLAGLIRFVVSHELPLDRGGFRWVRPDFTAFAKDLIVADFRIPERESFLRLLKAYVDVKELTIDWRSIQAAPDDQLVISLAMLCPFLPAEKQGLLEAEDLLGVLEMLIALLEVSVAQRRQPDRPLH